MDLYAIASQQVLERISLHCPEAMAVYLQCLNRCNQDGQVFFPRQMVEIDMSYGWTKFRNSIKKLALENLLEWHPQEIDGLKGIFITLANLEEYE